MKPISSLVQNGCHLGQGFGGNANPSYRAGGLIGHTGEDVNCGYGTPIAALASGLVYSTYPVEAPASDGYTAVFTLCETPLEIFEFSYGHVSEIDCQIGQQVKAGDVIAKEGNRGVVYVGNRLITLAEQRAGNHEGSHRHYQKRIVFKTERMTGPVLQTAQGIYRDPPGFYYQQYAPKNGFNSCVDWTLPLFNRDLMVGMSGYDAYLFQKALVLEGFATFQATGFFGAFTMAATIRYQTAHGISATGFVGPLTRGVLNSTYSQLS